MKIFYHTKLGSVIFLQEIDSQSKDSLKNCFAAIIEVSRDAAKLRKFRATDETKIQGSSPKVLTAEEYYFVFKMGNNFMNEGWFFEQCAKHVDLHEDILQYLDQVANLEKIHTDYDLLWQDEIHNAGVYAVAELALARRRFVPLLARYIEVWDMNHESFHLDLIDKVFRTHGPNIETMELLASRVGSGSGVKGYANAWRAIHHHGFLSWLNENGFHDTLISMIIDSARREYAQSGEIDVFASMDIRLTRFGRILWKNHSEKYPPWGEKAKESLLTAIGDCAGLSKTETGREFTDWLELFDEPFHEPTLRHSIDIDAWEGRKSLYFKSLQFEFSDLIEGDSGNRI